MSRYALLFFAICSGAVAAIPFLIPTPAVRLEADLSQLEAEKALARLETARDRGLEFTDDLELAYGRLALGSGRLDTARAAFERVIAKSGPAAGILESLARIEAMSGEMGLAAARLRAAYEADPTDARRLTLGHWFRILRDSSAEIAVLRSVTPDELSRWERARLGKLLLTAGRDQAYLDLLVVLADSAADDHASYRARLIEALIDVGKGERAVATALRWHRAAPENRGLLRLVVQTLIGRGAIDAASTVAWRALAETPDTGAVLVTSFIRGGHGARARALQTAWLNADPQLSRSDWVALTRIAEISGDLDGLRTALARHGGRALRAGDLPAAVFLQFVRYQGAASLLPYGAFLTPALLEEAPIVAAGWANLHRRPRAVYDRLVAATRKPLSDWDQEIWIAIAEDLRGTSFYPALVAGAAADAGLREKLRARLAPTVSKNPPDG